MRSPECKVDMTRTNAMQTLHRVNNTRHEHTYGKQLKESHPHGPFHGRPRCGEPGRHHRCFRWIDCPGKPAHPGGGSRAGNRPSPCVPRLSAGLRRIRPFPDSEALHCSHRNHARHRLGVGFPGTPHQDHPSPRYAGFSAPVGRPFRSVSPFIRTSH